MKKERLDKVLVDLGYFETRQKAQAAIMAQDVKVNGETITKAGHQLLVTDETNIEIKTMPYVSRGGFKLEKALNSFEINLENRICLDAGASTGGFSDCMLQRGAKFIYAVDVGYGQFAWKLRQSDKIKVIERTNVKNCSFTDIYSENEPVADFCAMDLSFISITKVLPNVINLLGEKKEFALLIKPQFEAGKELVGKNGVVRDKNTHIDVIKNVIACAEELGLNVHNLQYSPIRGPKGNIEYLIHLKTEPAIEEVNVEKIVDEAVLLL